MWLNLEAGTAHSLRHRQVKLPFEVPTSPDSGWHGRRSLVVDAANTYFPEAEVESLPSLATAELASGLGGRLRNRISATDPHDPELFMLRDQLIAALGATPDVTGALTVVDRVYTSRVLRHQVPPVIGASCVAWHGRWRAGNHGPALATAQALQDCVTDWTTHPEQRPDIDTKIVELAQQLAVDHRIALEELPV